MPEMKNERAKAYMVIGLAIVLMVVVYFRFIHKKKVTPAVSRIQSPEASLQFDIPQIKIPDLQNAQSRESLSKESMRAPIRDIFAPLKLKKKVKSKPRKRKPSKVKGKPKRRKPSKVKSKPPGPKPKLTGTIVGEERAIAIINDQFVHTGDWIGEYKVVRIGEKEVLLSYDTKEVTLRVSIGHAREEPSVESKTKFRLKRGDIASVIEVKGDWYLVKLEDGRTGWAQQISFFKSNQPQIVLKMGEK
jgi:hypothetical protein